MNQQKLSVDQVNRIVELTLNKDNTRPYIAEQVGCGKATVYRYQKSLRLV